jgi:hypothetical protein
VGFFLLVFHTLYVNTTLVLGDDHNLVKKFTLSGTKMLFSIEK